MFWPRGKVTEAGKIGDDSDAKNGCLVTTHGVEPNVKVAYTNVWEAMPFRLSVDVPKAAIAMIISLVACLLQDSIYPLSHGIPNNELSMLTVMTIGIGYFMSIL